MYPSSPPECGLIIQLADHLLKFSATYVHDGELFNRKLSVARRDEEPELVLSLTGSLLVSLRCSQHYSKGECPYQYAGFNASVAPELENAEVARSQQAAAAGEVVRGKSGSAIRGFRRSRITCKQGSGRRSLLAYGLFTLREQEMMGYQDRWTLGQYDDGSGQLDWEDAFCGVPSDASSAVLHEQKSASRS